MSTNFATPDSTNAPNTALNTLYALTRGQVLSLLSYISTATFIDNLKLLTDNPMEYLVNLRLYPFNIKTHDTDAITVDQNIYLGTIDTTIKADSIGYYDMSFDLGSIAITENFNSFLDYSPYTKIELYLPYMGFVNLDTNSVMGKTLSIKYVVDIHTGIGTAYVMADGVIILSQSGNIGIEIPLGGRNGAQIAKSMLTLGIGAAAGAISLGAGAAVASTSAAGASVASVAPMIGASAGYMASTTVGAINSMQEHVTRGTIGNGYAGFFAPQNAYLIITRPAPQRPANYNATVGRPSGATAQLSTLTGFTVVDAVHVDGLGTATQDEIAEVERLLKSGVIL